MGELAGLIASLPSAVTHHVSTLAAAGLVARMRRGRRVLVDRSARGTALLALYEDD
jgi:DNA-binding MarR family transcriptional regulator